MKKTLSFLLLSVFFASQAFANGPWDSERYITAPAIAIRTNAPDSPGTTTQQTLAASVAPIRGEYTRAIGTSEVVAGIEGLVNNTGTAAATGGGHGIGVIGIASDTIGGQLNLYGVEGKVFGKNGASLQYYQGVLGQSIYIGTSRNAASIFVGNVGNVYNYQNDFQGGAGGATYTGAGISVDFLAPAITGGQAANNFSFWGFNTMKNEGDIKMMLSGSQGYIYSYDSTQAHYIRMYHDGTNSDIETDFGNIFVKPASGSNTIINNGGLIPLVNGTQTLGTSGFGWSNLTVVAPDNTIGLDVTINATQANVTGTDFYAVFRSTSGVEGSIAGTGAAGVLIFNTFTGSHWTNVVDDISKLRVGMVLEITPGKFESKDTAPKPQLFKCRISSKKKSSKVVGVWGGRDKDGKDNALGLGTGFILIANKGEKIEAGDYLVSSNVFGHAELQKTLWWKDNVYKNYTIARATENVKWQRGEKEKLVSCIYLGG